VSGGGFGSSANRRPAIADLHIGSHRRQLIGKCWISPDGHECVDVSVPMIVSAPMTTSEIFLS
jgi:hypothetical protein